METNLITTQDGSQTIFSEQYGVTYHSRFGAITESTHVFINAGLRYKAAIQRKLALLEVGFGSGLNAFLSSLEAEKRNLEVSYLGLDAFPISIEQAQALQFASFLGLTEREADFVQMHTCPWNTPVALNNHFLFEKRRITVQGFMADNQFDLIYYDAFAPTAQPELWTEELMSGMFRALKPDGVLVTYCAQGAFKRNLKTAGFIVEALSGPPGKREMTRGLKPG